MTRFRVGAVLGFASGYYLGTKAGRQRYEQLNRLLRRVRRHEALDHAATAVARARAVLDLTRERVVDIADHKTAGTARP